MSRADYYYDREDDYESLREISRETRKARRLYRCDACGQPIAIGDTYRRVFYTDGETAGALKQHQICPWEENHP